MRRALSVLKITASVLVVICSLLGVLLLSTGLLPVAVAQGIGTTLFLTGGSGDTGAFGRSVPVPAYLKSANISTNTTTIVKASIGVLGCVVVNTGQTGGSIVLYNSPSGAYGSKLATISTVTPGMFCYAAIFSGGLSAVTTSSSTASDITITYR